MINFFRKIRKGLLTENKFSKYLLYAFGEIVLVVIGIIIALQINSWNQSRKQFNNELELYAEIYDDLNSEYYKIKRNSRQFDNYSKVFSHIYKETIGDADYNPELNYNFLLWFHRYKMFITEKYAKSLDKITNDEIHQRLKQFMEVETDTDNAINEWNEHMLKQVIPFLSRQGINKTKAMFNTQLDGFASIINQTDLIEYSKLKEQYGTLEFDQLLFITQFNTTWALQNLVWQNEINLRFQNSLKKELQLHNIPNRISYWEKEKKYNLLVNEAGEFYDTKEYQKSVNKYKEAFEQREPKLIDRYNAACSFALAEDVESAFGQLFFLVKGTSGWKKDDWVLRDSDLKILHKDNRWKEITSIIKANIKEAGKQK